MCNASFGFLLGSSYHGGAAHGREQVVNSFARTLCETLLPACAQSQRNVQAGVAQTFLSALPDKNVWATQARGLANVISCQKKAAAEAAAVGDRCW
jgi:hypothetical protein